MPTDPTDWLGRAYEAGVPYSLAHQWQGIGQAELEKQVLAAEAWQQRRREREASRPTDQPPEEE